MVGLWQPVISSAWHVTLLTSVFDALPPACILFLHKKTPESDLYKHSQGLTIADIMVDTHLENIHPTRDRLLGDASQHKGH